VSLGVESLGSRVSDTLNMIHSINGTLLGSRPSSHAHYRVRDAAVAMAHELYDTMMQDDKWYGYWKKMHPGLNGKQLEEMFVERNLSRLLIQARAVLAQILQNSSDEKLRETIYEALLQDATLIKGRK
jgi:hypothetical protein